MIECMLAQISRPVGAPVTGSAAVQGAALGDPCNRCIRIARAMAGAIGAGL
jgi:hypothetical protein